MNSQRWIFISMLLVYAVHETTSEWKTYCDWSGSVDTCYDGSECDRWSLPCCYYDDMYEGNPYTLCYTQDGTAYCKDREIDTFYKCSDGTCVVDHVFCPDMSCSDPGQCTNGTYVCNTQNQCKTPSPSPRPTAYDDWETSAHGTMHEYRSILEIIGYCCGGCCFVILIYVIYQKSAKNRAAALQDIKENFRQKLNENDPNDLNQNLNVVGIIHSVAVVCEVPAEIAQNEQEMDGEGVENFEGAEGTQS